MRAVFAVALLGAAIAVHAQQPIRGQVRAPQGQEAPRAPRQPQRIVLVDRIVAVVGREVVTASELDERRELAERQLRQQGTPLPERGIMERQILERLIIDKAQLQLAKENGIRVEEVQLDRALERIAENNKMSLSAFRDALDKAQKTTCERALPLEGAFELVVTHRRRGVKQVYSRPAPYSSRL